MYENNHNHAKHTGSQGSRAQELLNLHAPLHRITLAMGQSRLPYIWEDLAILCLQHLGKDGQNKDFCLSRKKVAQKMKVENDTTQQMNIEEDPLMLHVLSTV